MPDINKLDISKAGIIIIITITNIQLWKRY